MPDHEFNADLRDLRFVLFEQLPFRRLRELPPYGQLDADEVSMLLDEAFKFNRDVIAPINKQGDREGCRYEAGKVLTPTGVKEAYRQFCDNGWLAVSSPETHGGMGLPKVVGIATGELNIGANCSFALTVGLSRAAASLLEEHGSEEMKKAYVSRLLSGEWQGTMCLTEPQAGSAVGDIKTMAKPDGATWLLSGTKSFITCAEHDLTANHVHLVLARTPDAPKGFKGISLFLVPKHLPAADGSPGQFNDVVCAGIEHKMGIKASPTCTVNFGENDRCRGFLIGEIGNGLPYMFHMMNEARIGVGLQGVGLASAAYLYAKAYAAERVQGVDIENMRDPDAPRVTIDKHPDVKRMLLFCKAVTEGCRGLLYHAGYLADVSEHHPEARDRDKARGVLEFLTPIVKAYISDMAFDVTRTALQVMGGYGYIGEYPVEQYLRDVKIASIYEGTNGIQALDLLGRKLSAKGGALFMAMLGELNGFVAAHRGHLALGDLVAAFGGEVERWQQTTMKLGGMGMAGDRQYPVLSATPYLEMTGHAVTAWMLLTQAVIAHDRLQGVYLDRKAMDPASRARLVEDDAEARFYANKIEAAHFFVHHVLVRNRALAAEIDGGDRSVFRFAP